MPISPRTAAQQPTYYYVAVHDAGKTTILAGPYLTEPSEVTRDAVRDKACAVDCWAWFYTFSLARSSEKLTTLFGVV